MRYTLIIETYNPVTEVNTIRTTRYSKSSLLAVIKYAARIVTEIEQGPLIVDAARIEDRDETVVWRAYRE